MSNENVATIVELSEDECFSLLATIQVGRLAVSIPGRAPLVVPVNFILDRKVIVFRSDSGTKIDALHNGLVSFQADRVNGDDHTGWSVLAAGRAYEATHWEVDNLKIATWAPGAKGRYVRIVVESITGRRLDF